MINANPVCNFKTDRLLSTNPTDIGQSEPSDEYWLLRNGEPVLRTTNRTEVASWIRENGTKGLKVLVPAK